MKPLLITPAVLFLAIAKSFSEDTPAPAPESVILPHLSFYETRVSDAIGLIRMKVEGDFDQPRPLQRNPGISVVVDPAEGANDRTVDLELTNISAEDAVKAVARAAGLAITKDGNVFIVAAKGRGAPARPPEAARSKAATLIIPHLQFWDTWPMEAADYFKKRSRDLDPAGIGVKVSFALSVDPDRLPRIKLDLTKVSVADAVTYYALVTGLKVRMEGEDFIQIKPTSPCPRDSNARKLRGAW